MDLATLPGELLGALFSYLSCKDLTSVVCVNSTWSSFANVDSFWKEAMFNNSFPHLYSSSQKDIPWRQIVKRHFAAKRNIINKRCVQSTLCTRCPTSNRNVSIVLKDKTANGKYALLVWETLESKGSYYSNDFLSTELWDLETRTKLRTFPLNNLSIFNDYIVARYDVLWDANECHVPYTKLDPSSEEISLNSKIRANFIQTGVVSLVPNREPQNTTMLLSWGNDTDKFISAFDLRDGSKIFDKTFADVFGFYHNLRIDQFYGSKIVLNDHDRVVVVDVKENREITFEEDAISCATIVGNDLWIVSSKKKCLIKYDITTMKRQQYDVIGNISDAAAIYVFDGIIWMRKYGRRLTFIDVSSASCRVIGELVMHTWDGPHIAQMPNGAITILDTFYANILSFRDEDVELPIQVMQIEPDGQTKVLSIKQGDLNTLVRSHFPHSVSSEIFFEVEDERYCIIFSFLEKEGTENLFIEALRPLMGDNAEYHKTAIFQLAHFDHDQPLEYSYQRQPDAYGPCWVFFETKVNGAWQKSMPADNWDALLFGLAKFSDYSATEQQQ